MSRILFALCAVTLASPAAFAQVDPPTSKASYGSISVASIEPKLWTAGEIHYTGPAAIDTMRFLQGGRDEAADDHGQTSEWEKNFRGVYLASPGYVVYIKCARAVASFEEDGSRAFAAKTPTCYVGTKAKNRVADGMFNFDEARACDGANGRGFPGEVTAEDKFRAAVSSTDSNGIEPVNSGSVVTFVGGDAADFMKLLPRVASPDQLIRDHVRRLVIKSPGLAVMYECRDRNVDVHTGIDSGAFHNGRTECQVSTAKSKLDADFIDLAGGNVAAKGFQFIRDRDACQH